MFRIPRSELEKKAYDIRKNLIDLIYQTKSGHLDTSLSLVEIWLSVVYSDFFKLNPKDGSWTQRDRIFLSEGHACPIQYMVNADLGYYSVEELFEGNRKPFSPFQGHTVRNLGYGLENSNGSLSIGLWQAYGHALTIDNLVFCVAGDGEFQEPTALGILSAPHNLKPLGNFILLLNNNKLAQDSTVDIGPLEEVAKQYNWQTLKVNGHDFDALEQTLAEAVNDKTRPTFLICDTVKGYGGDPERAGKLGSHGKPPSNDEEYNAYINGLKSHGGKV